MILTLANAVASGAEGLASRELNAFKWPGSP
jgi:hypothetical protein